MTRKHSLDSSKSWRPGENAPGAQPNPAAARARRRFNWAAGSFAVSLVIAGVVWADWYFGLPEGAQAQFVGRQTCIQCHQPQHQAWHGSHHDLAMDRATEETVLGDFSGIELTHHGDTSRMFRRDGKFFVHTEGPDGQHADFEVKYVFGVEPLQQYLVEFDRPAGMPESEIARLQVLRISWDTRQQRWFHLDPPDVKEKLEPSDELHWTGLAQRWNHMCADCHSTNLQKNYDVASGTYHTTFAEIDVSCEACHGPGSLHVELAQATSLFWDRQRGYALAQLKDASNVPEVQACAPCHSRRRVVTGGYTAGCNYYDYFANEALTPAAYHADGQILDEVYEFTSFLESKMYGKNIRCTDCHDPHTARLKKEGNAVCTSCHQHPAGKYDGEIHHRHAMGTKGAQCVECHMPQTTYMDVDPRRDHSLRVPRPDLSVKLGTPNACTGCHLRDLMLPGAAESRDGKQDSAAAEWKELLARDDLREYAHWLAAARRGDAAVQARIREVDRWADQALDQWYGANRKREPHFAEALHAARTAAPEAEGKLLELLNSRTQPAVARATAALELGAYVEPRSPVTEALRKTLLEKDPQIRTAAVLSLQQEGSDATVSALAPLLGDSTRLVRTEAARALAVLGADRLQGDERAAFRTALQECLDGARVDNDRAAGHLGLGILHEALGDPRQAEAAYKTATRVEPGSIGPRTNLAALYDRQVQAAQQQAMQLAQSGNRPAAEQAIQAIVHLPDQIYQLRAEELGLLERDALLAPDNAAVQGRIGLSRYLAGWRKEAEAALLAAALLEPRNVEHLFRLAIFYRDTGRLALVQPLVERLLLLQPESRMFQQFADEVKQSPRP
jgi:predicted CXXCH cytochrome family protein